MMRILIAFIFATALAFGQKLESSPVAAGGSGGGGSGTVTSVGLSGTANQITVTGASPITGSGSWTLSFPVGGVTLPGTTIGTFSGGLTGNASTATALAANGANCSAGNFPLGVDASGASESCTALPTTISGTANQITASGSTGAITLSIPTNPTLPGTTSGTFSGPLTGNVTGNADTVSSIASHASTELSDTASLQRYTAPVIKTYTTGTGGVTANHLVKLDTDGTVIAVTGTEGIWGIAQSTASAAAPVNVALLGAGSCVAEGAITAGHYLIAGTTDPTSCKDAGVTSIGSLSSTSRPIAKAAASASNGATFAVNLVGPFRFGSLLDMTNATGVLPAANGGTGVANANTITLAGNLVTSGANSLTLTTTGSTNVTLPTTGTLATLAGTEALTGKTYNGLTVTTTTGTFTLTNGKTLTVDKSLEFDGTDSTKMTFPTTNATIARTDAAQTFTGVQTFTAPVLGIPTSITLTNATGLPAAGVVGTAAILGANTFTALQTHTQASANAGIIASTGYSLTGSDATNMIDLAGTWNTTGTPTAFKLAITNTASNASSLLINLLGGSAGTTSEFSVTAAGVVTTNGTVTSGGSFTAASGNSIQWTSRARMTSPSDGVITVSNAALSDFTRMQLGGTSSSFPAIKRSSAALVFRLADDSADTSFTASSAVFSGLGSATGTPDSACLNTNTLVRNAALTCTVSSELVKNSFAAIPASVNDLAHLKPMQFEYNAAPGRVRWGFGAQQVASVNPALADGWRADGQPWSLDQNAILALTVKSLQEVNERLVKLEGHK